jgi:hypothetical protein
MDVNCGRFRLGGEHANQTHRFLIDRGATATDMAPAAPQAFDDGRRRCVRSAHSGGDW